MKKLNFITYIKLHIINLFIITLLLFGCQGESTSVKQIPEGQRIDIFKAFQEKKEVLLSSVAESVDYILLENCEKGFISEPYQIVLVDSLILIIAFQKVAVFSRHNGRYKYSVSSFGRGPDEYVATFSNGWDAKSELIYLESQKQDHIFGLNITGEKVAEFDKPQRNFEEIGKEYFIGSFYSYSEGNWIGYSENISGYNPNRLEIFNSKGEVLDRIPNFSRFDKAKYTGSWRPYDDGWFYYFKDSLRFFEMYNDTIFTISGTQLIPTFYFEMNELSPPYYLQAVNLGLDFEHYNYFNIDKICESDRFLFFTLRYKDFRHLCYYDKITNDIKVCDTNPGEKDNYKVFSEYKDLPVLGKLKFEKELKTIGFINDLDNFIPFGVGNNCIHISKDGFLTGYITASDARKWIDNNPTGELNLNEKAKSVLSTASTDNIIVMIVKLRE